MSSKLPPQYLFALALALCLAVVFLFFSMYVRPRQDAITALQSDLSVKQATAERYRTDVAALPKLKEQVAKAEADRAEFIKALPTTTQFGQVIAQIRTNVLAAKADMQSLNFANSSVPNLPAGVRATDVNMDVSGQFSPLFQVLRSLETQSRFTTINSVNLTLPAANSQDPRLDGKYTITVYSFDPTAASAPAGEAPAGTPATSTPGSAPAPAPSAPAAAAAPSAPAGGGIR